MDGTDLGSAVTLSGGSATSPSTTLLGAGSHTVQAEYSGDSNYAANTGSYTQVVNQAPLSIVPDNLSRAVGQANPTADVHVHVDSSTGTRRRARRSPGRRTCRRRRRRAARRASYPITVTDAGTLSAPNYDFPTADFGTGTLTVTPGRARRWWWARRWPNSTYGHSVSFTVTVSGGGPKPTGTVQFVVDGTDLGSAVALSGGSATSPSTTLLGAGSHTVQAQYSGDSNYAANTGSYTQVVNQAPLSIVPDNLSRAVGQANPTLTYTFTWIRQRRTRDDGEHHRTRRNFDDDRGRAARRAVTRSR